MVPAEMKIQPGRGLIKLPHPGGHALGMEFDELAVRSKALIGTGPDAAAIGTDFTLAIEAASAGPVAGVLGALGFRTEKGQVLDAAVTAMLAVQEAFFAGILQGVHGSRRGRVSVDDPADSFQSAFGTILR